MGDPHGARSKKEYKEEDEVVMKTVLDIGRVKDFGGCPYGGSAKDLKASKVGGDRTRQYWRWQVCWFEP